MHHKQQGFTLIELMTVVAIIGIIASVALPTYQGYLVRTKLTELVVAADACKTSVAEYYSTNGQFPADATAAGCNEGSTNLIAALEVDDVGAVRLQAQNTGTATVDGNWFVLLPTANGSSFTWSCDAAAGTTIPPKYLPANCR